MSTAETRVREELFAVDLRRLAILPFVAIPIHLGHIAVFATGLPAPGTPEHAWRLGIVASHSVLIVLVAALGSLPVLHRRKLLPHGPASWWILDALVLLVMLTGVAIVTFDQLVTPAITPLLVIATLVGVSILLPPAHSLPLYAAFYLAFFLALPWAQHDPDILLSNRLNGLTIAGLGFGLSAILWRGTRVNVEKSLVIEEQQRRLAESNRILERQSSELRALNATKDKLFSIIAHDLKNPFHSIIGYADMLRDADARADPHVVDTCAESIHALATQTHDLLENLLHWARMQQGTLGFQPRRLRLAKLVRDCLLLVEPHARRKQIEVVDEVPADLEVTADDDMLRTILRNLLSNAVKFARHQGRVAISARPGDGGVQIDVRDDGVGIAPDELQRLLQQGPERSRPGTASEPGSGLGLTLCREFTEQHGGKLDLHSAPGEGTTVTVFLPDSAA